MHSHKQNTVQLPVEIQLSNDNKFLQKLIDQNCVVSDGELNLLDSASEQSLSDLDCGNIMQDSENEDASTSKTMQNAAPSLPSKQSDGNLQKPDPNMQSVFNAEILEQLEKTDKRLDKRKTSDKSKNQKLKMLDKKTKVAQFAVTATDKMGSNPSALTDETLLQLKVVQRLQELSDLAKTGTVQNGNHKEVAMLRF